MCDITVLPGTILSGSEHFLTKMDKRYFDPHSTYEIDAEYVNTVSLFPEHLAIKEDSEMLKYFHMNLVTVSLQKFFHFTMLLNHMYQVIMIYLSSY